MQQIHVPMLGLRYWIALCLASVFGANMGDFFAHDIGLGHVAGLPFLALAFAAVVAAERFDCVAHEAYYWLAIVIVRTAATNLADFFSGDLKLPRPWVMLGLAAVLATCVAAAWRLVWRKRRENTDYQRSLLRADAGYWTAMLVAGTLGTVMGDFFSHDLRLGNAMGSVVLSALLAPFFVVGARQRLRSLPLYWTTIVLVRAAGTTLGDLVAARNALTLPVSTAVTGAMFVGFLLFWRSPKRDSAAVTIGS